MKRILVQLDRHPAAPMSANEPSDADDLTNCPGKQLLVSAGREFTNALDTRNNNGLKVTHGS